MSALQGDPLAPSGSTPASLSDTSTAHNVSPHLSPQTFHIGTRRSLLARAQTDIVVSALQSVWPTHTFTVHAMSTTGDKNQVTALHAFNEKALWTQELEELLQKRELDLIVHSLKDMPTQLPVDLELGCVMRRGDARDAVVVKAGLDTCDALSGGAGEGEGQRGMRLEDLSEGSVVGTSSLRRIAQLKRRYKHLRVADVRGNINTRLAKLDDPESEFSAIILAAAGLQRLGLEGRITQFLSSRSGGMLHAVGQGALGIEVRKGDARVAELLGRIGCERTTRAVLAERSLMRTLEGGCSVPIGVETEWVERKGLAKSDQGGLDKKPAAEHGVLNGDTVPDPTTIATTDSGENEADDSLTDELVMRAIVVSLDGTEAAEASARRRVTSHAEADQFGWEVARQLVDQGADKILKKITLNREIIREQGDA